MNIYYCTIQVVGDKEIKHAIIYAESEGEARSIARPPVGQLTWVNIDAKLIGNDPTKEKSGYTIV